MLDEVNWGTCCYLMFYLSPRVQGVIYRYVLARGLGYRVLFIVMFYSSPRVQGVFVMFCPPLGVQGVSYRSVLHVSWARGYRVLFIVGFCPSPRGTGCSLSLCSTRRVGHRQFKSCCYHPILAARTSVGIRVCVCVCVGCEIAAVDAPRILFSRLSSSSEFFASARFRRHADI